jgi:hypothetical protein
LSDRQSVGLGVNPQRSPWGTCACAAAALAVAVRVSPLLAVKDVFTQLCLDSAALAQDTAGVMVSASLLGRHLATFTSVERPARRTHRRRAASFKASVVAVCRRHGMSLSAVSLANGLNPNMACTCAPDQPICRPLCQPPLGAGAGCHWWVASRRKAESQPIRRDPRGFSLLGEISRCSPWATPSPVVRGDGY